MSKEGSDALEFDQFVELTSPPLGTFEIESISSECLHLLKVAEDHSIELPRGRKDYLRGVAYEMLAEWHLAAECFTRSLILDQKDNEVRFALGRVIMECNDLDRAATILKRALQFSPDRADIANALGLCLLDNNMAHEAVFAMEHAVALAPEEISYMLNLARCYLENNSVSEARITLEHILTYAPNDSQVHSILAHIDFRERKLAAAKEHAQKAIDASNSNDNRNLLLFQLNNILNASEK